MTRIDPITDGDRAAWRPLWDAYLEFYEEDLSEEQTALTFERIADPDEPLHGVIARNEAGEAVGIVQWLTHPSTWSAGPYCYLEDLYVTPEARGTGVARALIDTVVAWARTAGCSQVYWLTQAHNARARALYDKVADDTGFVHYSITL